MTPEQKQKFIALAKNSVRADKTAEMNALLVEVEKRYDEGGSLTKSYVQSIGLKVMGLIRIECVVDFIKHGQELAKSVDIVDG